MSSKPSDVLATVFLWVCFCIASLIVFKGLFGDEKPSTPPTTLSHNYIEPQAVLPQPLWSFDLPPPESGQNQPLRRAQSLSLFLAAMASYRVRSGVFAPRYH